MKFPVALSGFAISVAAFAAATYAAPPQADQAAVSEFACQLAGDCSDTTDAAASTQPGVVGTPGARSANVRGFTFNRTAPTPSAEAVTSAPAPSMSSASANAAPAAAPKRPSTPVKGAANLRLDFGSGSSDLDDADRQRLAALSNALSSPRLAGRRLRIEGHTDSKGSATKNRDLSRRRAQSVADYLVSTGVSRSRLEVVGYGAAQPLPNHPASDGANRRVMAVMLN